MVKEYPVKTAQQLGDILRGYRKEGGLTQQKLSGKAGVSQPYISQLETETKASLSRLFEVLGALDLEIVIREKRKDSDPAEW